MRDADDGLPDCNSSSVSPKFKYRSRYNAVMSALSGSSNHARERRRRGESCRAHIESSIAGVESHSVGRLRLYLLRQIATAVSAWQYMRQFCARRRLKCVQEICAWWRAYLSVKHHGVDYGRQCLRCHSCYAMADLPDVLGHRRACAMAADSAHNMERPVRPGRRNKRYKSTR